jgi:hypothetical protein
VQSYLIKPFTAPILKAKIDADCVASAAHNPSLLSRVYISQNIDSFLLLRCDKPEKPRTLLHAPSAPAQEVFVFVRIKV